MAEIFNFATFGKKKKSYRSLSYKNFIKDKMTGRNDILCLAHFSEYCKKVKIEVTVP